MAPSNIIMKDKSSWIHHQKELLEKERQAEIEASAIQVEDVAIKQLEAKGIAISKLNIREISTGLFGRPAITFVPRRIQGVIPPLPSHSFSSGDIVGIWGCGGMGKGQIASGVLAKVTSNSVQIALDEDSAELDQLPDDALFQLFKLANDVTYRRIKNGLEELEKLGTRPSGHLIDVLFQEAEPYEPLTQVPSKLLTEEGPLNLFNKYLDQSQVNAVKFALIQKELAVVHGPPGTGKTTTLVEIILQHIKLGCKILAVAPSNLAVDNLLEKLVDAKARVVRVGHPARATLKAQQRTLDALVHNSEDFGLIEDIHKDIKEAIVTLSKTRDKGRRFRIKDDIKNFRKELRERATRLSREILSRSDVVLTTLTSAGNSGPLKLLPEAHFDLTAIDECSQGLECACYLSAMKAPKLLIAGDHRQLPPTIISTDAAKEGFLVSLMERVIGMYSDRVTRMLSTQYRMNSAIMDWASEALYDNLLQAHTSVGSHLLCHMDGVDTNEDTENAMVLIDTAGCNLEEVSGEDQSKGNEGEANIVAAHVRNLLASGVKEKDVAVISPYNLQVEIIRGLLRDSRPGVEVRTVDGFQGREKEAVVISLVRSNRQGEVGFLAEDRRLNVAVTRARRHVTLVCDTDTVCRHPFIKTLVRHITANGIVKSGHEFDSEFESQPRHAFKFAPLVSPKSDKKQKNEKGSDISRHDKDKKKTPANEEENERRRRDLESKISDFLESDEDACEFPKSLNAFERLLVHEIAANKKLIHESQGEGKERFIVLKKKAETPKGGVEVDQKGVICDDVRYNRSDCARNELKLEAEGRRRDNRKKMRIQNNGDKDVNKGMENKLKNGADTSGVEKERKDENLEILQVDKTHIKNTEINDNKKNIKIDRPKSEIHKQTKLIKVENNTENITKEEVIGVYCKSRIEQTNNNSNDKANKNEHRNNQTEILKQSIKKTKKFSPQNSEKIQRSGNKIINSESKQSSEINSSIANNFSENIINAETKQTRSSKTINSETSLTPSVDTRAKVPLPTKKCQLCLSEVNVRNFDLHVLRCERLKKEQAIKDAINKRQTEIKGVRNKTDTDSKRRKAETKQTEEDDDYDIMNKYVKENNSCAFPRCKNRSVLLLQLCFFCRNNFCLSHHQAEIHGCGEEAKNHARTVLLKSVRNGVLTPGSGTLSKKPDPVRRGHLQRKLDKKLGELEEHRKTKKKDK